MQNARVFKKRYLLFILMILVIVGVYQTLHDSPLDQQVINKVHVNSLANLYITESSAGATTRFSYRFYLYDAAKSDQEFATSLEGDIQPFMITTDKDALKKVENDAIYLSIRGTIYNFQSPASYVVRGSIFSVPIYLNSAPF